MLETLLLMLVFIVAAAIILWLIRAAVNSIPALDSTVRGMIIALVVIILLVVFVMLIFPRLGVDL
jgi:hypothetical protein